MIFIALYDLNYILLNIPVTFYIQYAIYQKIFQLQL